jgi:hypothetical protein
MEFFLDADGVGLSTSFSSRNDITAMDECTTFAQGNDLALVGGEFDQDRSTRPSRQIHRKCRLRPWTT